MSSSLVIGWREWLGLPDLGLAAIRAKVDTGARSSALHVDAVEELEREGRTWLRFAVRSRRRARGCTWCEAPAHDRRRVTDSGGQASERWFIRSAVAIGGISFITEINLTNRHDMLFPMLLGRTALAGRFTVDPACSFLCGRPQRMHS